jgi:serine-type D-Ala-D-Ala carboxypeptidase/endopeptidase (penicillin-binding protein 4)
VRAGSGGALVGGVLALTLVAGAAGAVALRDQDPAAEQPPPPSQPTALPAPPAAPDRPDLLPEAGNADEPLPAASALAAQVETALADPAVGGRLAVSVVDVATREVLLERDADALLLPASTAKIVTAVAALTSLDPQERLTTRVLAGPGPGDVVLVGGGDTVLARDAAAARSAQDARLDLLAARVGAVLGPTPLRRVLVDDTLYSGPTQGPGWRPTYVSSGNVAPVTALMVDGGRVRPDRDARHADPALAAGALLAELVRPGAEVLRGAAPAGAAELAAVQGPPVASMVERMLSTSDNDLAESLARQVALAEGLPASFDGVAQALSASAGRVLEPVGVGSGAVRLVDGSGLSRDNLLVPGALARLLAAVSADEAAAGSQGLDGLSPVLTGLPVAGFDGTLSERYRTGPTAVGAGVVRAKTGTLMGLSALSGVVRTADGRLLAFALTADAVPADRTRAAENALDRLASSFAACGCR